MSNKRIDLHDDSLLKQIREHEVKYHNPTHEEIDTILHCAKGIGLIAELKRCYRIIDIFHAHDCEDFDIQLAFHEDGLCKYLKYPCGPCETSEEE